ncbi:hypothetical protein D3C85_1662410 [compost metagenome]
MHQIGTTTQRLHDGVTDVINHKGVVTGATFHHVSPKAAVEGIVTSPAEQHIVAACADNVVVTIIDDSFEDFLR